MIRARDLTIGYRDLVLVRDMDFEVDAGDVFLVLGGSGSGKTTLMRTMIGLMEPLGGTIEIEGVRRGAEGPPPYGVLFQSAALFGSMTLAENVSLPLRSWTRLDRQTIDEIVHWKLHLVGLDGFENHLPAELSGGMRKRAGIARALALESRLLFLDEPGAGLDPSTAAEIDELLLTLNASLGVTLVVVTHELHSIFAIGKTCILLDSGAQAIIARGDPRTLRDAEGDPRVRRFFHRVTRNDAR